MGQQDDTVGELDQGAGPCRRRELARTESERGEPFGRRRAERRGREVGPDLLECTGDRRRKLVVDADDPASSRGERGCQQSVDERPVGEVQCLADHVDRRTWLEWMTELLESCGKEL